MSAEWVGLLVLALLLLFLFLGIPVAFSLGLAATVATLVFLGPAQLINLAYVAFEKGSDNVFIVAPLFIFMAALVAHSGIAEQAFQATYRWLNRLPGALAAASIASCAAFAAVSGSSPATAATIGYSAIPAMLRHGYDKRLAVGAVAAGGTLGILIPPSVTMILYGIITETSIARLFIAGIVPGVILLGLLIGFTSLWASVRPGSAPPAPRFGWRERLESVRGLWAIAVLFLGVMGALYLGIATPAECAAIGAGGAFFLCLFTGRLTWGRVFNAASEAAEITAMVLFLLFGGFSLSYVIGALGVSRSLSEAIVGTGASAWVLVTAYMVLLLLLGSIMDPAAMMVLTLPVLYPVFSRLGVDPVWLGVLVTVNSEIGMITPPFGLNLFVLKAIVPENVALSDIVMGSLPYVAVLMMGLILFMCFPDVVLWLPGRAG
jgi:tripartite ATP-independent transporter DctM subunit